MFVGGCEYPKPFSYSLDYTRRQTQISVLVQGIVSDIPEAETLNPDLKLQGSVCMNRSRAAGQHS